MSKLLEQINKESKPYIVSDLVDIKYGFGLPEPKRIKGSIPVYASSGIVGYHNEAKVNEPAIIIGRKGNVGSLYFSEQPSYPIDTAFFIDQPKDGFDLKYVFYLLKRINLPRYGGDSAVPGLSRDTFYSLAIEAPSLPTQKKIAEILSAYDAKIENNNKIIKNLEATAQTIFNEWFVEFEFHSIGGVPVGRGGDLNSEIQTPRLSATPPQEGNKYKSSGGKMVESEMGEIPEKWEVKPLDEIAEFLNGVASQKYPAEDVNNSLPVIKIREMNSGVDKNSDRATKNIDSKYIIKNGDILFAWSGSLCLMIWVGGEGLLNQHIFKVTSENYPKWFIYYWTNKHLQKFKTIAEGKATTMGHIQRHHLTESKVVVPNELVLKKANFIIEPIFKQIILLQEENISLKSQRDQLLVKLI